MDRAPPVGLSLDKREHEKQEKPGTNTILVLGRAECLHAFSLPRGAGESRVVVHGSPLYLRVRRDGRLVF